MALNVWELVISDMKHRDEVGTFKYGKPLQCNDGRRTLQDAYEECLDMAVYLKKAILEQAGNTARCACGHCVEDHKEDGWCTWSLCNCAEVVEIMP